MFSPNSSSSRVRPQPIRPGSSAASTTDGMPTFTSGMPNIALDDGDAQVAGRRDLEAGAERIAVDARDHRHGSSRSALQLRCTSVMKPRRVLGIEARHLEDVGAADEGFVPGAGQHHGAQIVAAGQAPRPPR